MNVIAYNVVFRGVAVSERFYREDTNWGIFNIRTSDDVKHGRRIDEKEAFGFDITGQQIVTVVGNMQHLSLGGEYEFVASPYYDKKYEAWQYKPSTITSIAPKTEQQSRTFLSFLLTEKQVDTLMAAYPNIVDDVMQGRDNVDLKLLPGIGQVTWDKIKSKIVDNFVISDLITLLQPIGITYHAIMKMLQSEENPHILKQKIMQNPYYLTKLKGFGFKKVDGLAIKLKPEIRCSSERTYAFIKYYLNEIGESEGHTWVTIDKLRDEADKNIHECLDIFDQIMETETKTGVFLYREDDKVGLARRHNVEQAIYDILAHLNEFQFQTNLPDALISKAILDTENEQGFQFTDEQRHVIESSFEQNVTLISGGAGVGKTSISRAILNVYRAAGCEIAACSLSAKAAQRITEATGYLATTMHLLLGCSPKVEGFVHNANNPLPHDIVFLDESSMVNASLMCSLLQAIKPGARVIMCGDHLQLPPIGYGNPFSDLLQMKDTFQSFTLKTVHRQAAKSGILTDANKIRNGEYPINEPSLKIVSGEKRDMLYAFRDERQNMQGLAVRRFLSAAEQSGIDNAVLIVPRKTKCLNSTDDLNNIIQAELFSQSVPSIKYGYGEFKKGARVIQIENNYEKNVLNGEIGYVHDVDTRAPQDEECMTVKYRNLDGSGKFVGYKRGELDQISLAYCLTVHKTQGSEWDNVVVVVDMAHYMLLDSCLLYTAITRAKKKCLLIAEPDAFKRCIQKNKNISRQTWLGEMDGDSLES